MRAALCAAVLCAVGPAWAAEPAPKEKDPFVEVTVKLVVTTEEGHAVLLAPKAGTPLLPVFVGPCEANAIQMRLDRKSAPRPLTHELLSSMVQALGAKVVKVEIDDLRGGTFLGRIHLLQNGKAIQMDARPSDAIALALGAEAPIRVAPTVLERAGLRRDEKPKDAPEGPKPL